MVRPERSGDESAIHGVHRSAFPTEAEARIVDALRSAGRLSVSLVAEHEGRIVGHVALSPVTLDGTGGGLGLAPVAVLAEHRRQGIAASLVREGLAECARAGVGFVVVLGDPSYYARFGFVAASRFGLSDEYGGGDAFQVIELRPGAIARGALVLYAPELRTLE